MKMGRVILVLAVLLATSFGAQGLTPSHASSRRFKSNPTRQRYDCGNAQVWHRFGPMCYHVGMASPSSWTDAKARCAMHGGQLAQPHSPAMAAALASMMCGQGSCWIGMHDQHRDGVLRFLNGSSVHPAAAAAWWRHVPAAPGSCALLTPHFEGGGGAVLTNACSAAHGYLCEKRADLFTPLFVVAETLGTTLAVLVLSFAAVIAASVTAKRMSLCISGVMWPVYCAVSGASIAAVSFVFVSGQLAVFWLRLVPMIALTRSLRLIHRLLTRCMPDAAARAELQRLHEPPAVPTESDSDGEPQSPPAGEAGGASAHSPASSDASTQLPPAASSGPQQAAPAVAAAQPGAAAAAAGGESMGTHPEQAPGQAEVQPEHTPQVESEHSGASGDSNDSSSPAPERRLVPSIRLQRLMLAMASPSYRSPDASYPGRRSLAQVACLAVLTVLLRVILLPPLWLRWLVAGANADVWRRQRTVALLNALFMFRLAAVFDVHNLCVCLALGAWRADSQGLILSFAASRRRDRRDAQRSKACAAQTRTLETPEETLQLSRSLLERIGGSIQPPHPAPQACCRRVCGRADVSSGTQTLRAELRWADARMTLLAESGLSLARRSQHTRPLSQLDVDVMFRMALFTAPRELGCNMDMFASRPGSSWWGRSVEAEALVSGLSPEQVEGERTACRIGVCSVLCSLTAASLLFVAISLGSALMGSWRPRAQLTVLGHFESKAWHQSMPAAPQLFPETSVLADIVPLRGNVAALWLLATTPPSGSDRCERFQRAVSSSDARRDAMWWQWEWLMPLSLSCIDMQLDDPSRSSFVANMVILAVQRLPGFPLRLVLNGALQWADVTLGLLPYLANVPSLPVLLNCHTEGRPSALTALARASWADLWKFLPLHEAGELLEVAAAVGFQVSPSRYGAGVSRATVLDPSHAAYLAEVG